MTKRTYQLVADIISEAKDGGGDEPTLKRVADGIAELFSRENPKFRKDLFLKAAGIGAPGGAKPLLRPIGSGTGGGGGGQAPSLANP